MTHESDIQRAIHERIGARDDVRLWRASVGVGVPMSAASLLIRVAEHVRAGDYGSARALAPRALSAAQRVVRYGLPGMGDLMGIHAPDGRLVSIEVKSAKGREREEQVAWARMVREFGGIAGTARSVQEAAWIIEGK